MVHRPHTGRNRSCTSPAAEFLHPQDPGDGRIGLALEDLPTSPPEGLNLERVAFTPTPLQAETSTGVGLGHVLTEQRLQKAALLLTGTSMRIKEIAAAVGYEHTSSFTRQRFRAALRRQPPPGLSPGRRSAEMLTRRYWQPESARSDAPCDAERRWRRAARPLERSTHLQMPKADELEVVHPLAPPVTLATVDGAQIVSAELLGSVVILTFWATWCTPCR